MFVRQGWPLQMSRLGDAVGLEGGHGEDDQARARSEGRSTFDWTMQAAIHIKPEFADACLPLSAALVVHAIIFFLCPLLPLFKKFFTGYNRLLATDKIRPEPHAVCFRLIRVLARREGWISCQRADWTPGGRTRR